jgi:phosphatidylinositol alpha-mannosyltransferase
VRSHIFGLGEALQQRGHRVDVVAPSPDGAVQSLSVVGCGRSRRIAFAGTQIDLTWAPWRRVSEVARRGYDLMHFHTLWNPLMPFQLATFFRGPKVATFHDVAGPDTPPWARRMMPLGSEILRLLWLKRVIAVSPLVARYLKDGRFEIIANGLTLPRPLPSEGERAALLFLGRLEPRKGVGTLLRALSLMGAEAPPLWVAGDGPLRSELERLAADLKLRRVTFLGAVSDDRKWWLLRGARLLVAPSLGGESFGIVLTEALACGAVPLAADNPGYREVLGEKAGRLLFPVGDAPALADRLRRLLGDPAGLDALQAWGREHWKQYEWRAIVERVERVYRSAISDGR